SYTPCIPARVDNALPAVPLPLIAHLKRGSAVNHPTCPSQAGCQLSHGGFVSRREMLRIGSLGLLGLSLSELLMLRGRGASAAASASGFGKARSCIVLFSWGGMSHLEGFDPKPDAPSEIRGEYQPIATATPGAQIGQDLPLLARQTQRMAVVRSVTHEASDHRKAAYWNLTGHRPLAPTVLDPIPPSRRDWPCLGSMVAWAAGSEALSRSARAAVPAWSGGLSLPDRKAMPSAVTLPYPIADRGLCNGQDGGFLGMPYDPLIVRPAAGKPFDGVSPEVGTADLQLAEGVDAGRFDSRRQLLSRIEAGAEYLESAGAVRAHDHFRHRAMDMLTSPAVRAAFELQREPAPLREAYGDHICGQSVLLARRLTEAGVPLVTVFCSAGDLNSGNGAHWDTHSRNFERLKNDLFPPLDRAGAALLDDLASRGRLEETLVVWMTEFGRTPKINGAAGRDHFPNCYSVAMAGGGVRGGQVYGRSDRHGTRPVDSPCGPADLHATIFHALGIDPETKLRDHLGREFPLTDGRPLPLF
ncbi:MAG: DUF1501 domain-containing protein, partial [Pirellulales bacterium]